MPSLPQPIVEVAYPGFPPVYTLAHRQAEVVALFERLAKWSKHADHVFSLSAERLQSIPAPTNDDVNAVVAQVQDEIGKLSGGEMLYSSRYADGRQLGLREHPRTKEDSEIFVPSFRGVVLHALKQHFIFDKPLTTPDAILRMRYGAHRGAPATPAPPPPPPPAPAPKQDVLTSHTLPGVIFRRLHQLGFQPPSPLPEDTRYGTEWVWTRPSRSRPNVEIRVFTTCYEKPDGSFDVKGTGADAIRVIAYYTNKYGVPRSLYAGRRILRAGTWDAIADRISERVDTVETALAGWQTCKACGAPLFESKNGNWVCADICWKKGRYAD